MLEIPVIVLVLQIGINAALNNRGYNSHLLIPSARFVNSGQTRRVPDSDSNQSSRGISDSDEQSDSEYSSFEDYSFRSVRPLKSRPNQRQNDYLRYNTRPENEVSLELPPVGRIGSNDYDDGLPTSSSSRQKNLNFRRPYLRLKQSNVGQSRNYYRKAKDESSLEVSSLESSNHDDGSRLGEKASYLRSLLSLIDEPYNRRDQNRKYYRKGNNLSLDVSPIDKLEPDEDAVNSLPNSPYKRQRNRKEYDDHQYDFRFFEPPEKDVPDAYIDTILLVTDDDQPDEIPIGTPKLENPERRGLSYNKLYNRRHDDGLNLDDDISYDLSPFRGLKPRLRSSLSQNSRTRKINRKSNDNAGLESLLIDELFPDGDNTRPLTVLRLASLEDLKLDSPLLRNRNQKKHDNRKSNRRNFLRLSLSPNNKITLDEGVASDLSELLSETLDELNLEPVNLRRTGLSNNKYSRRENNRHSGKDNLSNLSVLRLGSVDIPNAESPLRRYRKRTNSGRKKNLREHRNNKEALKKLFDDDAAKNLVPYHEVKSNKLPNNRRNEIQNNDRRDDFPDEFSLDTLFDFRNEDHDDKLDLESSFSSALSVLANQDNLNLEPLILRSSNENQSKQKDSTDILHLEFPWNDQLIPNGKSQLRSREQTDNTKDSTDVLHLEFPWNDQLSPNKKSQLRNREQTEKTKDTLHLEFPWNDQLSPNGKSQLRSREQKDNSKDSTDILHLEFPWNDQLNPNGKSQLKNREKTDKTKDTTDTLHLEFPWNDQLSPNGKSQLRNREQTDKTKDTTDTLHLEFPWNDQFSPNGKSQLRNREETDETKDTTDTLHLEFPWNDQLSPNRKSQLRSREQKNNSKDSTDILHLEFPWNDQLSPNGKSQLRNGEETDETKDTTDTLHLEFPWNDQFSPNGKSQLRNGEEPDETKDTTDTLPLEFPWNDQLSANEKKTGALRSQSLLRTQTDRQDKEPKDELKLEFPWNDKISPAKPSGKKMAARIPDPFFVHPYLRNRNIHKHPNYFRRSYDEYTEGVRLQNLNDRPSKLHRKRSYRRLNDNQSLSTARGGPKNGTIIVRDSDEDTSNSFTLPLDRRPHRLRSLAEGTPPLVTTTDRPNDTEPVLNHVGDKKHIMIL